jgi:acylphosphatase
MEDDCTGAMLLLQLFLARILILCVAAVTSAAFWSALNLQVAAGNFFLFGVILFASFSDGLERNCLRFALMLSLLFATASCRVLNQSKNIRAENKKPLNLFSIAITLLTVVFGVLVLTIPSEGQCGGEVAFHVPDKVRGAAYKHMFENMYGTDGKGGASWQLHPYLKQHAIPAHMSTFVFEAVGKLHGTSYRKSVRDYALKNGVTGYVVNSDNNSVLGRAEGKDADLKKFRGWLKESKDGLQIKFNDDVLMYKFHTFQVIKRHGKSKEDALKAALTPGATPEADKASDGPDDDTPNQAAV